LHKKDRLGIVSTELCIIDEYGSCLPDLIDMVSSYSDSEEARIFLANIKATSTELSGPALNRAII
jgi:hypothetical protein